MSTINYNNFEEVFSYEHLLEAADLCRKNVGWKASVQNFMAEKLDLKINMKKTRIEKVKRFTFLKKTFTLYENGSIIIKISRDSHVRMRRKLKRFYNLYIKNKINEEQIRCSYMTCAASLENIIILK